MIDNGSKIVGVYDVPEDIGFLGYLYSKLPEEKIGSGWIALRTRPSN